MLIKKIHGEHSGDSGSTQRPLSFDEFVGQHTTKKVMHAAIETALTTDNPLGHILLSGPSGYGKTTLSSITASRLNVGFKVVTAYAISKPAEMISLLNTLDKGDILFIDELHRLKPSVEEVLYIAMEDYCVDMVMPDGGAVRVPLSPFSLIGATTKMESLSPPLKNRFIYKFHLQKYSPSEKIAILNYYLMKQHIDIVSGELMETMSSHIVSVPREIVNFTVQLKDFLIAEMGQDVSKLTLTKDSREHYLVWSDRAVGGVSGLHEAYLQILSDSQGAPVGLKTLAVKLGVHEKAVEEDIEPLLFELGRIEKTSRGRILL